MQETTQRIIKLLGLLLPDLLVKKCSYQTSLRVCKNKIDCKAGTTAKGQNLLLPFCRSTSLAINFVFTENEKHTLHTTLDISFVRFRYDNAVIIA